MTSDFELNVFINCPFDKKYTPLFDALLFSIYLCGYRPRCALEIDNSAQVRIEKINNIIRECKISFHDISRTELDKDSKLPRFNMPFELGLFLGSIAFGSGEQKEKIAIIADKEKFRYQKFISDVAGQDIKTHNNNPEDLIKVVRNTLNSINREKPLPGATYILGKYEVFQKGKPAIIRNLSLTKEDITYSDKIQIIENWLQMNL
ncbi:hypothetical protein [Leptospira bandrabouensis]|uniref:hypothetical protein n=1 Tax=Leptospira bandrabouensis TaxID=2484903 RepID=UPI001EE7EF41|nr:hypothetical protein [Leptospira bandrabouensis]MCG6146570.1 hypothetical protein [Leptospira bandrabouensis]MCG6161979.1 hypothetical protein [Leptospira bandrabouensis]MCG6166163.1 hypothetical protein [Leptospira bandrabouensis]